MAKAPDPVDKYVGSRVRMRRLMLGLSQTELADVLGISFQQVQKYENGTNRISASRLQESARFLQVPASFFFEDLPQPVKGDAMPGANFIPPEATVFLATRDGIRFVAAYMQIKSSDTRQAILRLVEKLAAA